MIYISSACIPSQKISDSIRRLAEEGYSHIELSGGTEYYEGLRDEVLELKSRYGLSLLCHNYFPPPLQHFTLNLASLNDEIFSRSFSFIADAIRFSSSIGAKKYGFHAGFFVDPDHKELGKPFRRQATASKATAEKRFCEAYAELRKIDPSVELYIENNVISRKNFDTYAGNPLMMTSYEDFAALRKKIDFKPLLDAAHLKVSCTTLGNDFHDEFEKFIAQTDYIHLSDNDAHSDQNLALSPGSDIIKLLADQDLKGKTITLEVYESLQKIKETYLQIQSLL